MKKQGISIALALTLILGLFIPSAMASGTLTSTEFIAPQYEDAKAFSGGLAPVKKNGKWGYIDEKNNVVIDFIYDFACTFSEGLAVVGNVGVIYTDFGEEDGLGLYYGFVDTKGKYTPFVYDDYGDTESVFVALDWIDFENLPDMGFYNGYVHLELPHLLFQIFKTDGTELRHDGADDPDGYYNYATSTYHFNVTEGLVWCFELGEGMWNCRDLNGNFVFGLNHLSEYPVKVMPLSPVNQGLAAVCEYDMFGEGVGYYGFVDTTGNWVIPPQYDGFKWYGLTKQEIFSEEYGFAVVRKDGKWGGIDKKNNTVIPFTYDDLGFPRYDRMAFQEGTKWGFLDMKQNVVIKAQYDKVTFFNDSGYAIALIGEDAIIIDKAGNEVPCDATLDKSAFFRDGYTAMYGDVIIIKKNNLYGFAKLELKSDDTNNNDNGNNGNNNNNNGNNNSNSDKDNNKPNNDDKNNPAENNTFPFTDVSKNAWYYNSVLYAYENNLFSGTSKTTFSPNNTMTRAMMVTVLYKLDGATSSINGVFNDVSASAWYYDAVNWAAANGIVSGTGNNRFSPDSNITREQMAAILFNYCKVMDIELPVLKSENTLSDTHLISAWAADAVDAMYAAKILSGKGGNLFDPQGNATRAEVATMFMSFLEATK